jgi:tyrosine-protein kinase Etk/Wzc
MKSNDQSNSTDGFEKSSSIKLISSIAFRYLPFWPVFLVTIITCLTVSYLYLKYQTPIYDANATILLKDQSSGGSNTGVLEALGVSGSTKKVENEIEVIKSRTLLQQLVRDMGLYAQIYSKGHFHDVVIYPTPIKFIATYPDTLQNSPNIPISFKYISSDNCIDLNGKKYPLGVPVVTPYGEFTILLSKQTAPLFAAVKGEFYLQVRSIKSAANNLSGSLSVVSAAKESSLIGLKLTDQVPLRSEDILNNLIKIYNTAGINDKNLTTANTLYFIDKRLVFVNKDLSAVEDTMQRYRTKEGIVSLTDEGKAYLENVQHVDESMSQIQIQLDVLDEVEKYIVKKGGLKGIVPSTVGVSDPLLNQLLSQLYNNELDLNRQSQISGENSPGIISLKQQIDQLRSSLLENVHALRQNLLATQNRLQSQVNKSSYLLRGVPQKERAMLEISRQQSIKNTIYTFLLQKREETALSAASAVADSRVVNYAESNYYPIKPIPFNIYLIGLSVGIITGVLFVLIREQFNQKVLFRSDIERLTNAPVLAEIMHDESEDALVIRDGKRTVIAEQFRALRTSLNYIGIQGDKKTILVTSSISGEGKSFMGANLAVSLSLTGKKVALLEFDLRKPKISKMMNIAQEPGISNYLAGLATYNEIIVPMEDNNIPGLFILPAGSIPPNPTELMLNGRLDELMEQLKKDYDYILIDSPPIGLVTDAKILNKYIDACLYMVRHKYTPKYYINLIENLYSNKEMNNLNIIFNGIKARGILGTYGGVYGNSYGYGYGYGYGGGDGYGYTQDADEKKKTSRRKISKFFNNKLKEK